MKTGRRRIPIPVDELAARYHAGESLSELAAAYMVNHETVRKRLRERGVTLRTNQEGRRLQEGRGRVPARPRRSEPAVKRSRLLEPVVSDDPVEKQRAEKRDYMRIRQRPIRGEQPRGEPARRDYGENPCGVIHCPTCREDTIASDKTGRCLWCDTLLELPAQAEAA